MGLDQLLASQGPNQAFGVFIEALQAPEPEVRFWSAFALGQLRDRGALPALERLATTDRAVVPGWWAVTEEARDAITAILSD